VTHKRRHLPFSLSQQDTETFTASQQNPWLPERGINPLILLENLSQGAARRSPLWKDAPGHQAGALANIH
jgi:hypothetical protein